MSEFLEILYYIKELPIVNYRHEGFVFRGPHWHEEVELVLVTKGVLNLGIEGDLLKIRAGEVYIINGGINHFFLPSPDSERVVIQIGQKLIENTDLLLNEENLFDLLSHIEEHSINWEPDTTDKVTDIVINIDREMTEQKEVYTYKVLSLIYSLFTIMYREIPIKKEYTQVKALSTQNKKVINKLNKVYKYVENNYHTDISLNVIAHHVGYNADYFSRFFKEKTGMKFTEFLNNYRINMAKWLLITEDLNITDIAHKSGFNSVKTFHHVFKENVKQTPFQYRKSMNNTTHHKDL